MFINFNERLFFMVRNKTRYYMDEDTIVRYYRQSGLISYDE